MQEEKKMVRKSCRGNMGLKKGPWSPEEDELLISYIQEHGCGRWHDISKFAGLNRCGKSCRLRWTNYLRPGINRGHLTPEEEKLIIHLQSTFGNKWASIASRLPGRTDNDIKNLWNTHLKKRLGYQGINRQPLEPLAALCGLMKSYPASGNDHSMQWESARLEAEARFSMESQYYNSWTQMKKPYVDPFLKFWNSDVGEAFRIIGGKKFVGHSISKHASISGTSTDVASIFAASSVTPGEVPDEDVSPFIHYGKKVLDCYNEDESSKQSIHFGQDQDPLGSSGNQKEDVKPSVHHGKSVFDWSKEDEDVKPLIHNGKIVLDWSNEDDVKPVIQSAKNNLNCSSSKSTEDSSDFILRLLLDFPSSDDDLIFLENHANFCNIFTDNGA